MNDLGRYRVRVHGGARRIILRIDRDGTPIFTVPPGCERSQLDSIFSEKSAWIEERQRLRAEAESGSGERPPSLDLQALGVHLGVLYENVASVQPSVRRRDSKTLVVRGDLALLGDPSRLLCEWLKRFARQELARLVEERSIKANLRPVGISVRSQRTRWGSCSSSGHLSLNVRLLFLPTHLAELVIDHELCHLVHMNHSAEFWSLLESLHPRVRDEMKELKSAVSFVPTWVL